MKLVIWRSAVVKTHGQFFWHVLASNGKKLAWSGEGYKRRSPMDRVLRKLFPHAYDGSNKIKVVEAR